MFGLNLGALAGRKVLDCASGGASFTADAARVGVLATACDPLYAEPVERVESRVRAGVERAAANVADAPANYEWTWFPGPDEHRKERCSSAERFLDDLVAAPERYVAGSLPALPFRAGAFDLVLCSYLLFTYAPALSLKFHVDAIDELLRVAGSEVRVFPTIGFVGDATEALYAVRTTVAERGWGVALQPVDYRFQAGADHMLRIWDRG